MKARAGTRVPSGPGVVPTRPDDPMWLARCHWLMTTTLSMAEVHETFRASLMERVSWLQRLISGDWLEEPARPALAARPPVAVSPSAETLVIRRQAVSSAAGVCMVVPRLSQCPPGTSFVCCAEPAPDRSRTWVESYVVESGMDVLDDRFRDALPSFAAALRTRDDSLDVSFADDR